MAVANTSAERECRPAWVRQSTVSLPRSPDTFNFPEITGPRQTQPKANATWCSGTPPTRLSKAIGHPRAGRKSYGVDGRGGVFNLPQGLEQFP